MRTASPLPLVWSLRSTAAARGELIDAQDWYEAEAPGLGRRFRAEVGSAGPRMADNPRQFPVVYKTLRRARTNKFHYALFFLTESDLLLVTPRFHHCPDPHPSQERS